MTARIPPRLPRTPVPARLHWLNPGKLAETTHRDCLAGVADLVHGIVLDVGCGRQPHRHLFPKARRYVGLDLPSALADAPVDVVGDAEALPFRAESVDTVICVQVFDYVWEPHRFVEELARVLRPHGYLLVVASQANREHDAPNDFFRVTRFGLARLATSAGLMVEQVVARGGFWTMVGHATSLYFLTNFGRFRILGRPPIYAVCGLVQMICGALEWLHSDVGDTLGHLLVARKPAS